MDSKTTYVNNAFLNGELKEEVYTEQTPRFEVSQPTNLVSKVHKALNGLLQAPRARLNKLHDALLSFGFIYAKLDQPLFVRVNDHH